MPDTATTPSFGVIILAGGRASRLGGADKPGLVVGDRTLLDAVIAAATGAGARPVIVVGPGRPGTEAARGRDAPRFVREEPPGAGPVPALRRGLAELSGEEAQQGALETNPGDGERPAAPEGGTVAVLAADLPFLRPAHIAELLAALAGPDGVAAGRAGAIMVDDEGRPQWLAGCWRIAALKRAAAGYAGSSLHGLLAPLRPAAVVIRPDPGEPPPWLDCDTEADLRRARDWQARDWQARASHPNRP